MNNLETEIEMKEDLENDLIEDEDACDDVKNDSSRVYLTQPSDDLNRYMAKESSLRIHWSICIQAFSEMLRIHHLRMSTITLDYYPRAKISQPQGRDSACERGGDARRLA